MIRYVIVRSGVVVGYLFVNGPIERPDYIRSDTADMGDIYNPETGEFTKP